MITYFLKKELLASKAHIPPRVLLAEQDPAQAWQLAMQVLQLGLLPLGPATTAIGALAELRGGRRPELAIVDAKLTNGPDGEELLKHLSHSPLIYLADAPDADLIERLRQTQPLALLTKPCELEQLRQVVRQGLPAVTDDYDATGSTGLFVRERGALVRVAVDEIACVSMEQQHAVLLLVNGKRYPLRLTLAEVLLQLPAGVFVQCHRSWAVNLHHVEQVEPTDDRVLLAGGSVAALGRVYRHHLFSQLRILG